MRRSIWVSEKAFQKLKMISIFEDRPFGEIVADMIDEGYKKLSAENGSAILETIRQSQKRKETGR